METRLFTQGKFQKMLVLAVIFFSGMPAFAQEAAQNSGVTTTRTTTVEEWYSNPLYWVIGALVLIILIALIARGGRRA